MSLSVSYEVNFFVSSIYTTISMQRKMSDSKALLLHAFILKKKKSAIFN